MRGEIILTLRVCKWFSIWNENEGKPYLLQKRPC